MNIIDKLMNFDKSRSKISVSPQNFQKNEVLIKLAVVEPLDFSYKEVPFAYWIFCAYWCSIHMSCNFFHELCPETPVG